MIGKPLGIADKNRAHHPRQFRHGSLKCRRGPEVTLVSLFQQLLPDTAIHYVNQSARFRH